MVESKAMASRKAADTQEDFISDAGSGALDLAEVQLQALKKKFRSKRDLYHYMDQRRK